MQLQNLTDTTDLLQIVTATTDIWRNVFTSDVGNNVEYRIVYKSLYENMHRSDCKATDL